MEKLDTKDYAILRELDVNFRMPFSFIAKKVSLSKNSVALRFKQLEKFISHSMVALDYDMLGYTEVRIFYTFDFYNNEVEEEIMDELKKHKNMAWAARIYGHYDLCVCLIAKNMKDFISQINEFNRRFENKISSKDMLVLSEVFHFRHNYLYKEPIEVMYRQKKSNDEISLSKTEMSILNTIMHDPRMKIIDIAEKTGLTPKTVSNVIRDLEKRKIIKGYFMSLDPAQFSHDTFKLHLQVHNTGNNQSFENYLLTMKNIRFMAKTIGLWDYIVDCIYPNFATMQQELEKIKRKFPSVLKHVEIMSLGSRIATNSLCYLEDL